VYSNIHYGVAQESYTSRKFLALHAYSKGQSSRVEFNSSLVSYGNFQEQASERGLA